MRLREALAGSLQAQVESLLAESLGTSQGVREHAQAVIAGLDLRPHSQGRKIIITGQYIIGEKQ